jgi:hypothetical protein
MPNVESHMTKEARMTKRTSGQRAAGSRRFSVSAGCRRPTADCRLPAARCLPPAARFVIWSFVIASTFGFRHSSFASASVPQLRVYPPEVILDSEAGRQSLVVVLTRADGVTEDVTAKAKLELAAPNLARREGATLYPLADGQTLLGVGYGGRAVRVPVVVRKAKVPRPISFRLDVMPVFMRGGCNTGSCHGSARGKDGFHLSLFGFDPAGDYYALTRQVGFRRVNLAIPEESLLLEKATGSVPHTGGKRFETSSPYYLILHRWLEAGAPDDIGAVPQAESVELYPPQMVLYGPQAAQQMIARAKYSDGSYRDVTDLAVFLSNNDNSAVVSPSGLVKAANRGEAFILARFATRNVGSQVIVLPAGIEYTPPGEQPANYIDELVGDKLRKLRVLPSGLSSDEAFLRRATIDVTGRLPTEDEYRRFMADADPAKRARLIDQLLRRKEFAEIWAMKWAEILMIRSTLQVSYKSAYLYATWLADQISRDVPINRMVREMLSASGGTFSSPATNFFQVENDTLKTAENVAQAFMGLRIQCGQCHNHPFDRWTMDDYYGLAAFFCQIGRKQAEDYRETIVYNSGGGEVRHPVGGRVMRPKFLGGAEPNLQGEDRRAVFADWLTSPDNPFFAPSVANRIWAHFFGLGIVEPVDDMRVSNPPSNPELLAALAKHLTGHNYDFKSLVRDICNSHAYQRSTRANDGNRFDQRNFARGRIRRIQAEMLLDCISQATETKDKFPGLPLGARAVQIADGASSTYFLSTFGRSPRETVCACDVKTEPTLSQALHLLNGDTVQAKIRSGGAIARMRQEGKSSAAIVESLFIRALARRPTRDERDRLDKLLRAAKNPQDALEDIFWSLLNSREFLFNH